VLLLFPVMVLVGEDAAAEAWCGVGGGRKEVLDASSSLLREIQNFFLVSSINNNQKIIILSYK
jgi:hypothetical protein